MATPKRLSSRMTVFFKWIFPVFVVAVWVTSLWLFIFAPMGAPTPAVVPSRNDGWQLYFIMTFITAAVPLAIMMGRQVKHVVLNGDALIVSSYGTTIHIPTREIAKVSEGGLRTRFIDIQLHHPTRFGTSIRFKPPIRWTWGFTEDPIITELRGFVETPAPQFDGVDWAKDLPRPYL